MPLNYEGEIWNENIKISANYKYLTFQEEIYSFLHQFHFSKNFKIKEILTFENALKNKFNKYKIETKTKEIEKILFLFNTSLKKIYPSITLKIGIIKYPKLASIILFVAIAYIHTAQFIKIKKPEINK